MGVETVCTVAPPALHPLLARLLQRIDAPALEAGSVDSWADASGHALLVFTEDPVLYRETLDLAVIVPELVQAMPGRFRVGVLLPQAARAIASRYGFRRWPALVLLKSGRYVGAIDGLRDWREYRDELSRLLEAESSRPPTVGIPVASPGADAAGRDCH